MKLILDIGNTRTKAALFDKKELLKTATFVEPATGPLDQLLKDHGPFTACMISSVRKDNVELTGMVSKYCRVVELDHLTKIPLKNKYKTPETLGKDRLAAAIGAYSRFPGKNILVVDAGTAITYEVVTRDGEYLGGGISPGIDLRFKALNTFTGKLPLVERQEQSPLLGADTRGSILSGVMKGVLEEVRGMIAQFSETMEDPTIIITGGDANYFVSNLKNDIFALPNLVLEGLNEILDIND